MQKQYKTRRLRKTGIFKILPVLLVTYSSFGQARYEYSGTQKGQLAVSWGWNRAAYSKSNISFRGMDYDFKLFHVVAHDRPTLPVNVRNYLRFKYLTVPQTNLRISYFIKDGLAISFGDDHMKYVMDNDQSVMMKGVITRDGSYKGTYDKPMVLTEDFLTFEHSDGLNYLNVELEKYFTWYHSTSDRFIISGIFGGGLGVLFPKTNTRLLDYPRNDRFHVSGVAFSGKLGVQAIFFKHLLLKVENKYGYALMPDIVLHKKGISGRARQDFLFAELYATLGVSLPLKLKKKKNKKTH